MVFIAKTQFSHKQFYNHLCTDFHIGRYKQQTTTFRTYSIHLAHLAHIFSVFKINFQVQVLKPKDFSKILSPRRCVVIIYKIRCKVKIVKVKM